MLAHVHGQLWNASQLSRSLDVSAHTANRYLDALCQTYLVRRLVPHFANIGKRLRKAPKVYLADTGLLHALLGIPNKDALLHHPAAGFSWEGFVVEQVAALLPFGWELFFWHTSGGSEIDILLLNAAQPAVAIEAKLGETNPRPRRGFHQACADLQIPNCWHVYPGQRSYTLEGGYNCCRFLKCWNVCGDSRMSAAGSREGVAMRRNGSNPDRTASGAGVSFSCCGAIKVSTLGDELSSLGDEVSFACDEVAALCDELSSPAWG
jgi:hypothetical protein